MPNAKGGNARENALEKLAAILDSRSVDDRLMIETLVRRALQEPQRIQTSDLWDRQEMSASYWLLVITGVHQEEEMKIARELLFWKAFVSRDSASVRCIQSSDRGEYRFCSSRFQTVNCPTLIFSDSPEMLEYLKIDSTLLFMLADQKNGIERFVNKIHSMIENGANLGDIQSGLHEERFWKNLKLVYSELKNVISIKIG
jgi:hypothetical protein